MSEVELHRALALGVIATALPTWFALRHVSAPYGRHARAGFGPTVPARLGWIVMESPACVAWLAVYALGSRALGLVPLVLLAFWQLHYVHRAFVQPLTWPRDDKRTPALIVALAMVFNVVNAYLNARQVSELGRYAVNWLYEPRFIAGAVLFLGGLYVNVRADRELCALKAGGAGYRVPRGRLFRLVSCPNYAGEIVEWLGWALMTSSLAGLAFALFTASNLVPRARSHHAFYRERFPDYPPERRALIPWVW